MVIVRKRLKYRNKILLENFSNNDAAFVDVFQNINNLEEYWNDISNLFIKKLKNKNLNFQSNRLEKNTEKIKRLLKKSISKRNHKTYFDFDNEAVFRQKIKILPKSIRIFLNRNSRNLTSRDRVVLYQKSLALWNWVEHEEFILEELGTFLHYIRKAYQNPREYLDISSRTFIEDKINEFVDKMYAAKSPRYLYLLSTDVNGLKTVNDFGVSKSHYDGNKFLLVFTNILQSGKTTKLLSSLDIKVNTAAQSGDEFLLLFESKFDLSGDLKQIEKLYLSEMLAVEKTFVKRKLHKSDGSILDYEKEFGEIDIANIIDFESPDIKLLMKARGVNLEQPQKFKLTCSMGWGDLSKIIEEADLANEKDYFQMRNRLRNLLFAVSDSNSIDNKLHFKAFLKQNGFEILYVLFTVRADYEDLLELREGNQRLLEQIHKLEEILRKFELGASL